MKTAVLIETLAADAAASPREGASVDVRLARGAVAGLVAVVAIVLWTRGLRPDFASSLVTPAGVMKLGGGLALAAGAFHCLRQLARPGRPPLDVAGCALVGLAAAIVLGALAAAQATAPFGAVVAATPHYAKAMALLALAPLATVLIALRGGAPTRPVCAGGVGGALAGALSALGYALWCPADDALFVMVSYGASIAVAMVAGAALGARLLRW